MPGSHPKLGLTAATAMVIGNIVGVMIFLTPATVASHLPFTGWYLAAWALGGLLALLGALSLAELGAALPEAGGDYVYIRRAYGERMSFLSGWTSVVITFPGSIAAMAVGLCQHQAPFFLGAWVVRPAFALTLGGHGWTVTWYQILGLGVIGLFTGINWVGVRISGWLQTVLTASPVLLMLAAGVAALCVTAAGPVPPAAVDPATRSPWAGLWPAIVPIFFAYAGWNVTTYFGGDIRDPGRVIPRSLIVGTLAAAALYLVVNAVFLKGVPVEAMPGKLFVPAAAAGRLFGAWAASFLNVVIALAVLSSINATILAGARISYAMAGHGLAFAPLRRESPRFGTPAASLGLQAALAAVLVLSGRFEQLVDYVTAVMLVFSSVAVAAVVVLRVREPDLARPYRTLLYPVTPVVYVVFCLAVVIGRSVSNPRQVLWGLAITLLGLPVCELLRRRRKAAPAA